MDWVGGGDSEQARARAEAFRRRQAPENEVPVSVAWDAVLLESPNVVVFVAGARVYSTGVEFTVVANARREPEPSGGGMPRGLMGGHRGEPGALLIGVEYDDGRTASSSGGVQGAMAAMATPADDAPALMRGGGGGSSRHATQTLFLTPAPTADPFRIVAVWEDRGFGEGVTELPVAPIVSAQARVRRLWDVEPPQERAPRPPQVPPGGWFERHHGRQDGERA